MRIHKTLGEDLWEFTRICETLGEDSQGFMGIREDLQDFGREFARICETLGEDSRGFMRLWKRIHKDYAVHLLQYFAIKVAPKIKTNSIIILDL